MRFFPADLRPPQPLLARVLPLLVALPGLLPPAVAMAQTSFGTVNVGSTTAAQTLTFSFPSATVLNATTPVQVLTMGDPNLDFKNAGTGTCAAGAFTSCTVNVTFNPQASGMRQGNMARMRSMAGGSSLSAAAIETPSWRRPMGQR